MSTHNFLVWIQILTSVQITTVIGSPYTFNSITRVVANPTTTPTFYCVHTLDGWRPYTQ
jgi:hypothetical protein